MVWTCNIIYPGEYMSQAPQKDGSGAGAPPRSDGGAPKGAPGGGPQKDAPKRKPFRDRTVTITLTLPKAVFSVLFFLFLLVWAFIFGVMLGRGHNPEEIVPELAKVMPSPAPQVEAPHDESMNNVLRPQDLKYHDSLKGKDAATPPKAAPAPRSEPPKPAPAPKPVPQAQAPKPAPQNVPVSLDGDQTVYNYIYQVAASTNKAAADGMQKKLEAGGLSAKVSQNESNGVTWYRILVSFKGKPDDTRTLRAKLAQHGISTIILRGKAPAK